MKLLKYSEINHNLIKNLINEEIYFACVDDFDDPSDYQFMLFPSKPINREELKEANQRVKKYLEKKKYVYDDLYGRIFAFDLLKGMEYKGVDLFINSIPKDGLYLGELILRKEIGVSCFSVGNINPVLFSQYASAHRGICIEYILDHESIQKVKEVKYDETPETFDYIKIISGILDHEGNVAVSDEYALEPLLRKHESWKHQSEYRIFYLDGARNSAPYSKYGLEISKIYFGSRVSSENIKLIKKVLDKKEIKYFYYHREFSERMWGISNC